MKALIPLVIRLMIPEVAKSTVAEETFAFLVLLSSATTGGEGVMVFLRRQPLS